jgi:hypothetical protein
VSGRRLFYCFILAGMCLLLVGCGGPQNWTQIGPEVHPFLDGLWDGITVVLAFGAEVLAALELIDDRGYGIFDVQQTTFAYDLGFMLGAGGFLFGGFRFID